MKLTDPKRYPEPETEYDAIDVDIVARTILLGDELRPAGKVTRVTRGNKYMTAFVENDVQILRVVLDDTITVTRHRETPESRERYARWSLNRELVMDLAKDHRAGLTKAQSMLNDYLNEYHYVDYQRIGAIMEEQAEYGVWVRFAQAVEYCEKQDDFGGDLVTVFDDYCDELKKHLLNRYSHRAISRSSNVLSNLIDDVDREAMAIFLDRNRWR